MQMGQAEGAVSIYEKILLDDPNNNDALFGMATTYHRMGQFDEARDTYIKILTKDPNNWDALNNLMVLAGEEAPIDALKELTALELLNPEFGPIPAQIGLIYLRLNKTDEAIKNLTRAIILSPSNLAYRYNLAVILDHAGHKKQAARLYKLLLKANNMGYKLPESPQRISERLAFIASSPIMVR
jgi:tetratricopeptide (TPR) repeat protein